MEFYYPDFMQTENPNFSWEAPFIFESLDDDLFVEKEKEDSSKGKQRNEANSFLSSDKNEWQGSSRNNLVIFKENEENSQELWSLPTQNSPPKLNKNNEEVKELEKENDWEINGLSEPSIYEIEYFKVVEITLKNSRKVGKELAYRKDVVNKIILRLFRKSIAKLFTMRVKRPSRSNKTADEIKDKLLKKAISLGLLDSEEMHDKQYREFVWWMAMSKITKKAKPMFDYRNKTIKTFSNILHHYSHGKLSDLYEDRNIERIYKYFMDECLQKSLSQYPDYKRIIYTKAAMDIAQEFRLNCDNNFF